MKRGKFFGHIAVSERPEKVAGFEPAMAILQTAALDHLATPSNPNELLLICALEGTRTPDLRFWRPLLSPAELRGLTLSFLLFGEDLWTVKDSNQRPSGYEPDALPTELTVQGVGLER